MRAHFRLEVLFELGAILQNAFMNADERKLKRIFKELKIGDIAADFIISERIALALAAEQAQRGNRRVIIKFLRCCMNSNFWPGKDEELRQLRIRICEWLSEIDPALLHEYSAQKGVLRKLPDRRERADNQLKSVSESNVIEIPRSVWYIKQKNLIARRIGDLK